MKPHAHKTSTNDAFIRCNITDNSISEQVMVGSTANDRCEFQGDPFTYILPNIAGTILLRDLAVYQSHYGCIVSLHCMAKGSGIPAVDTLKEIQN